MARPTNFKIAQREKFLESALDELTKLLEGHRSGKKVLETSQLIQLCQPMILKDMAQKLEIENMNDMTGEQKYLLLSNYLNQFKRPDDRAAITT